MREIITLIAFPIYKIFIQGTFSKKTIKDYQDAVSDFIDYSISWIIISYFYLGLFSFLVAFAGYVLLYLLTYYLNWSNP